MLKNKKQLLLFSLILGLLFALGNFLPSVLVVSAESVDN